MMLIQEKLRGTGIAIITPFLENGTIDWKSFKNLINFWIDNKASYLVVLGTTGESATLTTAEKQEVFSFVQEQVNRRIFIVAGIGGNDTNGVVAAFTEFDITGYDAILSVAPYYNKPRQEGIYQHYKSINDAAPLPVIMYNVPGRTAQNITSETTIRIATDCKKIVATKEASGDFEQIARIIKNKPDEFMVISGNDNDTLPMIAIGAQGLISVVANAFPKEYTQMVELCLKGDFKEALKIHLQYLDIVTSLFSEGSPSGIKEYMHQLGLCKKTTRLPVVPVPEIHTKFISELIELNYKNSI